MDVNMLYTAKGQILKAKMETGVSLDITRIAAGAGRSNEIENLENLVDIRQELTITGKYQRGTQSMIFAVLSNKGLQTGYDLTQIGIFANDPDEGEILYRVAQLERAFPISAEKDFPNFAIDCNFTDTVSNASQVNVVVNPAGMVSHSQFETIQTLAQEAFGIGQEALSIVKDLNKIGTQSSVVVSDTEPTEPCEIWLKPMGGVSILDAIGGLPSGELNSINITGAHIGDEPPEDTSKIWFKPIQQS